MPQINLFVWAYFVEFFMSTRSECFSEGWSVAGKSFEGGFVTASLFCLVTGTIPGGRGGLDKGKCLTLLEVIFYGKQRQIQYTGVLRGYNGS